MWINEKPSDQGFYWFRDGPEDVEPYVVSLEYNYATSQDYRDGNLELFVYEGDNVEKLCDYDNGQWQKVAPPVLEGQNP